MRCYVWSSSQKRCRKGTEFSANRARGRCKILPRHHQQHDVSHQPLQDMLMSYRDSSPSPVPSLGKVFRVLSLPLSPNWMTMVSAHVVSTSTEKSSWGSTSSLPHAVKDTRHKKTRPRERTEHNERPPGTRCPKWSLVAKRRNVLEINALPPPYFQYAIAANVPNHAQTLFLSPQRYNFSV